MKKPRKPQTEAEVRQDKQIAIRTNLTLDDIERVKKAFADGDLEPFGITEINITMPSGEEVPIGEWTGAETDRRQTRRKKPRGK